MTGSLEGIGNGATVGVSANSLNENRIHKLSPRSTRCRRLSTVCLQQLVALNQTVRLRILLLEAATARLLQVSTIILHKGLLRNLATTKHLQS